MVFKKNQEQANRLPPPRTLIMDFTVTHIRFGRSNLHPIGRIEILMTEVFAKINPTDPLRLSKGTTWIDPIPPVIDLTEQVVHGEHVEIIVDWSHHICSLKCRLSQTKMQLGLVDWGKVVDYESIKREAKIKPISECRCDERLKTKVDNNQ